MSYAVKEIFSTIQGEGANAGHAAIFLRFAGCNLWNGRESGRVKGTGGCSQWCDTAFVGTDGENGGVFADSGPIVATARGLWGPGTEERFIVCTGGEPLLQLDVALAGHLRDASFVVAVESNGTIEIDPMLQRYLNWVCISPKARAPLRQTRGDELKFVYPQEGLDPQDFLGLDFERFYLQPKDGPNREADTRSAIDYVKTHPKWRLSVQTHKYLGIP